MTMLSRTPTKQRAGGIVLAALLLGSTGCIGLDAFVAKPDGPPKGPVCKVVTTWIPQVVMTPDSVHNGQPMPCLAGRVYLFTSDLTHLVAAEGALFVDLYDPSILDPETHQPKWLERVIFDQDTLNQKLLKHDQFGWGYTMACPWGTYRPDIGRLQIRVVYQPKDGMALYSDPAPVTLAGQGDQPQISQAMNVKH